RIQERYSAEHPRQRIVELTLRRTARRRHGHGYQALHVARADCIDHERALVRHRHFERFRSDIAECDLLGVMYISAVDAHRVAANNRASGGIDWGYGRGGWPPAGSVEGK